MAKRLLDDEKYELKIKSKLSNNVNSIYTIDYFESFFTKERNVNYKYNKLGNKRGIIYLENLKINVEYESDLELKILKILDKSNDLLALKTQSLSLDYTFRGKEVLYYPDIVYLTKSGNIVILEVKDTISMCKNKNIQKYNRLSKYCQSNGFSYAMLNDNIEFVELFNGKENYELYLYLMNLLNHKKSVSWASIKKYCAENNHSMNELLTICLRYGLKVQSPKSKPWAFSIKK